MALIKCYECGGLVSDQAVACPKCGAPVKNSDAHVDSNTVDVAKQCGSISGSETHAELKAKGTHDKKNTKIRTVILIAILAVVILGGGMLLLLQLTSKASDEKIQNEAENLISISEMMGLTMEVSGAARSVETGMPTVLYVLKYPDGSSEFRSMSDEEKTQFDDAVNTLLTTLSTGLKDSLKEDVVVGINVMSSKRTYDFLGITMTDEAEIVAEYYDYGDEETNQKKKQEVADKIQDEYDQLVELAKNKKYEETISFYNSSSLSESFDGYSDSKKYFFYAQAMQYYDMTYYGEAYETLDKYCRGILDSDDVLKDIEDKVFYLDGLYKNESLKYSMYMSIYHGLVSVEIEDNPKDTMYLETLMDYEFTTGKKVFAMGSKAVMGKASTPEYVIEEMSGGKLLVGGAPEGAYTTYSGVYKKVSNTPLKERD
ncbi:hypothetical protein [Butyrivibrio sp.]|uniref:hypothetical protein n=1 Tax=Butyrivibrio sp. TaxID=28121 RepID=UPI0025BA30D0|nr:hypothetical protein [Butyrivibrio sp.]